MPASDLCETPHVPTVIHHSSMILGTSGSGVTRSGAVVVTNSGEWGSMEVYNRAGRLRRVNSERYIVNVASGWRREVNRLALTTSG